MPSHFIATSKAMLSIPATWFHVFKSWYGNFPMFVSSNSHPYIKCGKILTCGGRICVAQSKKLFENKLTFSHESLLLPPPHLSSYLTYWHSRCRNWGLEKGIHFTYWKTKTRSLAFQPSEQQAAYLKALDVIHSMPLPQPMDFSGRQLAHW